MVLTCKKRSKLMRTHQKRARMFTVVSTFTAVESLQWCPNVKAVGFNPMSPLHIIKE